MFLTFLLFAKDSSYWTDFKLPSGFFFGDSSSRTFEFGKPMKNALSAIISEPVNVTKLIEENIVIPDEINLSQEILDMKFHNCHKKNHHHKRFYSYENNKFDDPQNEKMKNFTETLKSEFQKENNRSKYQLLCNVFLVMSVLIILLFSVIFTSIFACIKTAQKDREQEEITKIEKLFFIFGIVFVFVGAFHYFDITAYINDIKSDANKLIDEVPSIAQDVLPMATKVLHESQNAPIFDGYVSFIRKLPMHFRIFKSSFTSGANEVIKQIRNEMINTNKTTIHSITSRNDFIRLVSDVNHMYLNLPINIKKEKIKIKTTSNVLEKRIDRFEKMLNYSFKKNEKMLMKYRNRVSSNFYDYQNYTYESQELINTLSQLSSQNSVDGSEMLNEAKRYVSANTAGINAASVIAGLIHIFSAVFYIYAFRKMSQKKSTCCAKYACIWPLIYVLGVFVFAFVAIILVAVISYFTSNIRSFTDGIASSTVSFIKDGKIEIPEFSTTLIGNQSRIPVKTNKLSLKFINKKFAPVLDFTVAFSTHSLQEFLDSEYSVSKDDLHKMLKRYSYGSTEAVQKLTGPILHAFVNKFINQTCFTVKLQKKLSEIKSAIATCEAAYTGNECKAEEMRYMISEIESILNNAIKNTNAAAEKILRSFDDEHFGVYYDAYLKKELEYFAKSLPMLLHNTSKIIQTVRRVASVSSVRKPAKFLFSTIAYNSVYILLRYVFGTIFVLIGYVIIVIVLKNNEIIEIQETSRRRRHHHNYLYNNGDESIPPVAYDDQYDEVQQKEQNEIQPSADPYSTEVPAVYHPSPDPYSLDAPLVQQPQVNVSYPIH